jgi:hypothetical protein
VVAVVLLVVAASAASAVMGSGIDSGLETGPLDWVTGDDADGDADTGFVDPADNGIDDDPYYDGVDDPYDDSYDDTEVEDPYYETEPEPPVTVDTTAPPVTGDAVVLPSTEAWAFGVADTLNAYFEGINSGDPQGAWLQFSSERQARLSLDDFAAAVRTSYDSGFFVQEAGYADGQAHVWLEFTSEQDPELGPNPGESCTRWSVDYVLVEQVDGTFRIDEVSGRGDTPGHSPC